MLTITDFVQILRRYYRAPQVSYVLIHFLTSLLVGSRMLFVMSLTCIVILMIMKLALRTNVSGLPKLEKVKFLTVY